MMPTLACPYWTTLALVLPICCFCRAEDARSGWRGDGSGVYSKAEIVTHWNDTQNVAWRTSVGTAFSSPIIAKGRVFVTCEPSKVVCLDLKDGAVRWKATLTADDAPAPSKEKAGLSAKASSSCGFASATPVCDGEHVYVVFGSGLIACFSMDGQREWVQYLQPAGETFGHSSSPLLIDGKLIANVNHLMALDAGSGKVVWECAHAEHTYGTPVSMKVGQTQVVVTPLGKVIRVSDGDVLAQDIARDLGGTEYGISPAADGDTVYLGDSTLSAVQLMMEGNSVRAQKRWTANPDVSSYSSPVVWNGLLFFVGKSAECFVIDAKSGKPVCERELKIGHAGVTDPVLSTANLYPSLVVAGGKLLVANDRGQVFIYEASKELKEISENRMTQGSGATPAIAGSAIIVRSGDTVCRIGK